MQLLAQANELASAGGGQPATPSAHTKKKTSSPSPLNIALSPSHPDHPANPIHHTPPTSPVQSLRTAQNQPLVTSAGDGSPLNRSGRAVSISMNDDSPSQATRCRRISDVSMMSSEILEMFPKWKNASTVPTTAAAAMEKSTTTPDLNDNERNSAAHVIAESPCLTKSSPFTANKTVTVTATQGEFVAHCAQALNHTLSSSFTSPSRTLREGHKSVHDGVNLSITPELPKKALLQWKVRRKIAELGAVIKEHYKDMDDDHKK